MSTPPKPSEPVTALILGGTTTVGRALASYLLDPNENRAKFVRLADRFSVKPPTTYIDKGFLEYLNAPGSKLEYRQVNLANADRHVEVFTPPTEWNGEETGWTRFDVLFDLTGEMGFDKPELMQISHTYQMAFTLATSCHKMAAELRPVACIRLHQPYYEMKNTPHTEGDKLKCDGVRGRWWHETLRGIGAMEGINFGVVRCASWYGPGTWDSEVVPRLVVGNVYKYLNEEMKFLYNADLRIHTVHAVDVAQALYLAGRWLMVTPREEALKVAGTELAFSFTPPTSSPFSIGSLKRSTSFTDTWKTINTVIPEKQVVTVPMFNVTDDGDSTQDSLAAAVAEVWGIKYGFLGNTVVSLVEKFAKTDFNEMVEDVNEKHVEAWSRMLAASNPPIDSSPLSPFLDAHAFRKMAICLDGSRIKRVLGFKPTKPRVEVEELRAIAKGFQEDHIW